MAEIAAEVERRLKEERWTGRVLQMISK